MLCRYGNWDPSDSTVRALNMMANQLSSSAWYSVNRLYYYANTSESLLVWYEVKGKRAFISYCTWVIVGRTARAAVHGDW